MTTQHKIVELPPMTPNPDVIDVCEKLLAHAKSGSMRSIAACCEHSGKGYGYSYAGEEDTLRLLGVAELMRAYILSRELEED